MNTTAQSSHRSIAVLKLATSVPSLLTQAQNIVLAITNNPAFPSPTPPLATVTDSIQKLQAAETTTLSRTKGAAAARNDKRVALVRQLQQLLHQVQTTADANPETSASVIESAGISVKKKVVRSPRVFAARQGPVSGTVVLFTRSAASRASYEWQYSSDAGKTWLAAPTTLQTRTTVAGLTPGSTVMFRSRPLTKSGEGDWSQPLSLIVH